MRRCDISGPPTPTPGRGTPRIPLRLREPFWHDAYSVQRQGLTGDAAHTRTAAQARRRPQSAERHDILERGIELAEDVLAPIVDLLT